MKLFYVSARTGELDLPYIGLATTTPRLVRLEEGVAAELAKRGAVVKPADAPVEEPAAAEAPAVTNPASHKRRSSREEE